jgi:hypothetical protein
MKLVRKSKWVQALCLFLAVNILFASCSTEYLNSAPNCSGALPSALSMDGDKVSLYSERMFELVYSHGKQEAGQTEQEQFEYFFGNASQSSQFLSSFNEFAQDYAEKGFQNYVSNAEHISNDVKSYLQTYASDLETFLMGSEPSLEDFISFQNSRKAALSSLNLCQNDQELLSFVHNFTIGAGRFFYKFQSVGATERGCDNFWQELLCVTLGATVALSIAVLLSSLTFVASVGIVVQNGDGTQAQVPQGDEPSIAFILGLIIGVRAGISFHSWCCSWFDEDLPECSGPTGSVLTETSCGEYNYREFGAASLTITQWDTENADPISPITPFPVINFKVLEFGVPTKLSGTTTCMSGAEVNNYPLLGMEGILGNSLFPLAWVQSAPQSFTYFPEEIDPLHGSSSFENTITVSVNIPANDIHTFNWTVNTPHTIVAGGTSDSNFARIKVPSGSAPDLNIGVTATNTCLNISETLNATVIIN